jgi:hypothetical protein
VGRDYRPLEMSGTRTPAIEVYVKATLIGLARDYDRAAAKGTCKNCPAFRERNRSALRLLRVEGKGKERRMLTANEYRAEAKACRELADRAAEIYVKAALIELARDYDRAARQAERREHHLRVFGGSENTRAVA